MSNSTMKSLIAGFAGAVAVNVLHELTRKSAGNDPPPSRVPRLDRMGQAGLVQVMHAVGLPAPQKGLPRYTSALASDVMINTALYAVVAGLAKNPLAAGAIAAISAGTTGVAVPPLVGLGHHTGTNARVKAMTFADYALGGIVTGAVLHLLRSRKRRWFS